MKIPTIIQYFRKETEAPIVRTTSLIFLGLVTVILIFCFLNTNSTINFIWEKQHQRLIDDAHTIKRDFQLQIDMSLRVLNTSRSFYEVIKHDLLDYICDGSKAICSGTTLEVEINQMYNLMILMYDQLYNNSKNSLVFYLDASNNQHLALTFQSSQLLEMYNSLNMTEVVANFQSNFVPTNSYIYFFSRFHYFASCLQISSQSSVYTCSLVDHKILYLQSNRTYFTLLNDQIFYRNFEVDISNISDLIREYIDFLSSSQYIGYDDAQKIVDQCIADYAAFSQNGLFQCMYSRTKLWSFPVLFEQLNIVLPTLFYKKLSYYREQYIKSHIKLVIIPDIGNSYALSKGEIDNIKQFLTTTLRYSILIIIGIHLFFMSNRLFVKLRIVNQIKKIGDKDEEMSKLIDQLPQQLKLTAQTIEKYQWVIQYSKSTPQNRQAMLILGLDIFSKEQYEYLSIVRYLYTTLISVSELQAKYLMAANLYERLIDLEMNQILKQEEKIDYAEINRIYQLQLKRIQCYDKQSSLYLQVDQSLTQRRDNETDRNKKWGLRSKEKKTQKRKQSSRCLEKEMQKVLGIGLTQLFQRLQEYKQYVEIDQRLIQRAQVLKVKLKSAYCMKNSFRLLQQLQNCDCDTNAKNEVRYIYAVELRKKKPLFDEQALDKLIKILKTQTTPQLKRRCLKVIIQILEDYPQQFLTLQNQIVRISSFYNYKKKTIFVKKNLTDRSYEKVFDTFVKDLNTYFGKTQNQDKNAPITHNQSSDNLYDSHLTSNNNMSFHSATYSFMKDLKHIADSTSDDSKFVIIYRNDIINNDKQRDDRREFQGIMQNIGTYLHIIVVGVHIKQDVLNKNRLIRLLKEKNHLMYVDLFDYDFNVMKGKFKRFVE